MVFGRWFLLAACLLPASCAKPPPERDRPRTIIVSGDTAGRIVPCGCATNQSGGLPRRATFLEERRKREDIVVVDVGGASGGTTPYDRLKFEAILRGEAAMGVVAHNIGRAEAQWGVEELRRLRDRRDLSPDGTPVPWISANTTDAEGKPFVEPAKTVVLGDRRVLFLGVLSQTFATETVRATPPRQAVLNVLRHHAGRYDHAVVLAYVPEEELRELAESLPEIDAVVGGPTGQPVPPQHPTGRTLTSSATSQGKFLVALSLPAERDQAAGRSPGPGVLRGEIVELDERYADDPTQVENLRAFYAVLEQRDLAPQDTPFGAVPGPPSEAWAGSKACQNCHEEEYRVWKASRHAGAWDSLVRREARYDPDCQRCHVTGYGRPGGFETVALSAERRDVGCESCHSGAAEHVAKTSVPTPTARRAREQCVSCHDRENSPRFEEATYWNQIEH